MMTRRSALITVGCEALLICLAIGPAIADSTPPSAHLKNSGAAEQRSKVVTSDEKAASVKELKSHPGDFLRRVQFGGEQLVVTKNGKPERAGKISDHW